MVFLEDKSKQGKTKEYYRYYNCGKVQNSVYTAFGAVDIAGTAKNAA